MLVVAGVTGHVGGAAAEALVASAERIRVVVRDGTKGALWSGRGAEVAVADLGDPDSLESALKDASGFFTLLPADFSSTDFYGDQRRMADAISTAAARSGVPHVVLLSSHGAELNDGTGFVKGLHYLENVLRATGCQLTAVRSGYRQENVATALAPARQMGIFPTLLPPDQPIRMVAAQDVGHLVVDCLKHPAGKNEIVDIQGPTYTMRQVADKLGAALGRDLQLVNIPRPGWLEALTQAGFSPRIAEVFIEMYDAFASGLFVPRGDRMVSAGTEIDDVIKKLIVPVHG